MFRNIAVCIIMVFLTGPVLCAENGYELWLRYRRTDDPARLEEYRRAVSGAVIPGKGATSEIIRSEFRMALPALLDKPVPVSSKPMRGNTVLAGTSKALKMTRFRISKADARRLNEEGYIIREHRVSGRRCIVITGNTDSAVLYGVFHFLRLLQTHQSLDGLDLCSGPRVRLRLLDHWDNLDGTIERGYAGRSLWNWDALPGKTDNRYKDYARACASIGINGTVVNNVNAKAESLTRPCLEKTAALAALIRPYGLRIYLSARFSAPIELGGLETADPRDRDVAEWWKRKTDEIYGLIPDFGGFLVKANSEGQPGPQEYGATHADGANMLANALAPHGGVVMWRAFVYDTRIDADRAKCAYKEFTPLDGRFSPNAFVQVKNGPIDFQPREPFHPLFGAMPLTPLMPELQITQEYLGQSTWLVFLAPQWKEFFDSDTYARGAGFPVSAVADGSADAHALSGIAGVANTGSDSTWCGHLFAQANWYAFGRLAWDHELSAAAIADEWIRMTWTNEGNTLRTIKRMMLGSWETCVNAMTPLGLHHIMREGHHYGPDPAFDGADRADWNSVYYHRADSTGIGFDRSRSGSDAVSQYSRPLSEQFNGLETCPEKFLLWFHRMPWNSRLQSGRLLRDELKFRYDSGVEEVVQMRRDWSSLEDKIDARRWNAVGRKLEAQEENARLWRRVCLEYFGKFAEGG